MKSLLHEQYANQAAAAYQTYTMSQDTEDCVNFLLTLKNRPMTPEHTRPTSHNSIEETLSSQISNGIRTRAPQQQQHRQRLIPRVQESYDSDASPCLMDEQLLENISVETLLGGSTLVLPGDRDLVPDPLYFAMAQMKPCALTDADRVGSYKSREIGFIGMCCKHCGGQPGFGKYFPATVRSLAQTTTSQTILKHISTKCRFCPPHIRKAVQELQRLQVVKESSSAGRPRYGSRKVFFQRVWSRLHDEPLPRKTRAPVVTTPIQSEDDVSFATVESGDESVDSVPRSRLGRFGALPTKQNLKRKHIQHDSTHKRRRIAAV